MSHAKTSFLPWRQLPPGYGFLLGHVCPSLRLAQRRRLGRGFDSGPIVGDALAFDGSFPFNLCPMPPCRRDASLLLRIDAACSCTARCCERIARRASAVTHPWAWAASYDARAVAAISAAANSDLMQRLRKDGSKLRAIFANLCGAPASKRCDGLGSAQVSYRKKVLAVSSNYEFAARPRRGRPARDDDGAWRARLWARLPHACAPDEVASASWAACI